VDKCVCVVVMVVAGKSWAVDYFMSSYSKCFTTDDHRSTTHLLQLAAVGMLVAPLLQGLPARHQLRVVCGGHN
jgi:hypothetical protein